MKDYYQPKGGKKGQFALRENVYRRTWYLIADYRYFKCVQAGFAEAERICAGPGPKKEELCHANQLAEAKNVYEAEAGRIARYIKAIEKAQEAIPEEYVPHIMEHIIERKKYKDIEGVSERTLKIWLQRFIWQVAHNLGEV